jgi:hypothetical protein
VMGLFNPDDVVNNPIISPPITQALPPITIVITPSQRHLLPRCCRQIPHHTASYYPAAAANYHITSTSFRK